MRPSDPGERPRDAPSNPADPVRVVIVGAGARGNRVFAELIATRETGFRTVGVVEPNEARREAFSAR